MSAKKGPPVLTIWHVDDPIASSGPSTHAPLMLPPPSTEILSMGFAVFTAIIIHQAREGPKLEQSNEEGRGGRKNITSFCLRHPSGHVLGVSVHVPPAADGSVCAR